MSIFHIWYLSPSTLSLSTFIFDLRSVTYQKLIKKIKLLILYKIVRNMATIFIIALLQQYWTVEMKYNCPNWVSTKVFHKSQRWVELVYILNVLWYSYVVIICRKARLWQLITGLIPTCFLRGKYKFEIFSRVKRQH